MASKLEDILDQDIPLMEHFVNGVSTGIKIELNDNLISNLSNKSTSNLI